MKTLNAILTITKPLAGLGLTWLAVYGACRLAPDAVATVVLGVMLASPVVVVLVGIDRVVMTRKGE